MRMEVGVVTKSIEGNGMGDLNSVLEGILYQANRDLATALGTIVDGYWIVQCAQEMVKFV